ncbi:hypothetical protein HMPREF1861_00268 [Corynebacterium kroppenstedtii]|nr:hypothetical protein HMPREF1861_00268 [Corynebacterium kroppenstedtii]
MSTPSNAFSGSCNGRVCFEPNLVAGFPVIALGYLAFYRVRSTD